MKDDERRLEEELQRLADAGAGRGTAPPPDALNTIRRRRRGRTFVAAGVAVTVMAGAAWASVAVSNRNDSPAHGVNPAQEPPDLPCDPETASGASECQTPTPEPSIPSNDPNAVLVFQLREGSDPYTKGSYSPSPRLGSGEQSTEGRLRAALLELVKGTTPQEEAAGFTSIFSPKTAGIVRSVRLDEEGRAIVEFADFREDLANASAAEGGTVMIFELNQTVFQFPDVQSVEYRIGDSCDVFWEFLQGACNIVTRSDFEQAP